MSEESTFDMDELTLLVKNLEDCSIRFPGGYNETMANQDLAVYVEEYYLSIAKYVVDEEERRVESAITEKFYGD